MSLLALQMGMSALQGYTGYQQAKYQASIQESQRKLQNTMNSIAAANTHNTINKNEAKAREASLDQAMQIQQQSMRDRGSAKVAAGASGVAGNSVDIVMHQLSRDAAVANFKRRSNLEDQYLAFDDMRYQADMSRITGENVNVIPKPSSASALLGVGVSMLSLWDQHTNNNNMTR